MPPDEEGSEYSQEGTMHHGLLADPSKDRSHLDAKQKDVLQLAETLFEETLRMIQKNAGLTDNEKYQDGVERRMQFLSGPIEAPEVIFAGTCDYWRYYPERRVLIIIDAKFGFLNVASADNNLQLAAYAVMAADEMPAEEIYTAIVMPRAPYGERTTTAMYTGDQVPAMRAEILRIVESSRQPNAPLHASPDACRYCRAKEICPEYRREMMSVATVSVEKMLALPAEEFSRVGDAIKLAAMLGKEWSKEAQRRIGLNELPGWKLKNNGAEAEITDLTQAYLRYMDKYGASFEDMQQAALAFMGCLSAEWGKIDALFAKLEKCGAKKARKVVNDLFTGLITLEEKAKSAVRE